MEALSSINSNTVIKQPNTIVRETNKEVCKNRIEMPFDDLLKDTVKKLMPYAMFLTYKNEADSEDLVQYTILKLIEIMRKDIWVDLYFSLIDIKHFIR